jgi:enoyl-CoA hydratase
MPVPDAMEYETVLVDQLEPGIVKVTMNRPDDANGVVQTLARDLQAAFAVLERDRFTKVVILTGAGPQFSGGADLKAMKTYLDERHEVEHEPFNARVIFPVTLKIATTRLIVIAAVNGGATAGGLDLASASDFRIASTKAKFGETYIKIGMAPGNGGTYFLPRIVGPERAAEMALTGRVIDAETALDFGLVGRVVEPDELIQASLELARRIADKPWRALEATKQMLRASWHVDLPTSFNNAFWAVSALHYGPDIREGVDAFVEKRKPEFGKEEPETMYWDEV